jgi:hypothetical protein
MQIRLLKMNNRTQSIRKWICLVGLAYGIVWGLAAADQPLPHFQEVLRLIRTNLPEVTETELNEALVHGLIARFQPTVELVAREGTTAPQPAGPWVHLGALYEDTVGYLRVGGVGPGLPEELAARWTQLRSTNHLEALILDLRFAAGQDFTAAALAADLFVRGEKPLLAWDDQVIRSTGRGGSFLPLAVLVNEETRGAAEAMAAALRETGTALIIGTRTAGQAFVYREFELEGATLRIGSIAVETGKGESLKSGVRPDIETRVPIEQERIFFADPFAALPGEEAGARSTRPRLTEAELVRRQRGGGEPPGLDPETGGISRPPTVAEERKLRDPALVQALDVLKGIVIVGPSTARD